MAIVKCFVLLTLVALSCGAPSAIQNEFFFVTSLDGGVLTAYPEEPADFPGHTYPIPGKVLLQEPKQENNLDQQWTIDTLSEGHGRILVRENSVRGNEVETYLATSTSFPMSNYWRYQEDNTAPGVYYIVNTYNSYCLNHNGLGSRIHQGICAATGIGSKWTLNPVTARKG